jgi:hypothetical protein
VTRKLSKQFGSLQSSDNDLETQLAKASFDVDWEEHDNDEKEAT